MAMRLHAFISWWRHLLPEELFAVVIAVFLIASPSVGATRFAGRSLYMDNTEPGATSKYAISLSYMTDSQPVGSLDMLFCTSSLTDEPCIPPPGGDVSEAVLSGQTGETGFTITTRASNHLVLTRAPAMIAGPGSVSTYTLSNIINTTNDAKAFAIRITSHSTTDGTGPMIDFGSVLGTATRGIVIETQVPPMLIFCLAEIVADDCASTNDNYYSDMGDLSPTSTLTAQSQMGVGTNASAGFVITANGDPPAAGTNVIDGLAVPTESRQGINQFGINLVANNSPVVGLDPEGTWANALPSAGYDVPNRYKFVSGEEVASSPNVSLMKKFTVSYIVNSNENLRPGVYTTTITFIASGRF